MRPFWNAARRDIRGSEALTGIDADLNHIPDAAMTVAVTALFAEGETTIRNVHNWRVKETDRLAAMGTELRKVGAAYWRCRVRQSIKFAGRYRNSDFITFIAIPAIPLGLSLWDLLFGGSSLRG